MNRSVLESVGLAPESREPFDGLVSVRKPPAGLAVDEAALVREVQAFEVLDYVFFRRFDDSRSSQPAALVVDNTGERLTEGKLAKKHHQLWLHGVSPLVYVAWPTRIDVLSCARGPDFWAKGECRYNPAEQLDTASRVETELVKLRRFSAARLADGTFWEDPLNQSFADHERAAHESLIRAVVKTDKSLEGETNLLSRRLLLLTVLIKYLEDRGVFPSSNWFGRYRKGARSFLDVLKGEEPDEVLTLLQALERKFNGDIFSLQRGARLTKTALRSFARLVEARTDGEQRYLWDLYSFGHLPVEVISHLYQRFVQGSTAVYTPPFLASLLLDHAMPYGELTGRERVLDPACGSGVFLVGAFRRLVNAWRAKHQWQTPGVETLKSILRNQIVGVELEEGAVNLTAFSLALALCDSLQPKVIWSDLRFDRLRESNLRECDFFQACLSDEKEVKFDIVVGNPPFESRFTEAAKQVNAFRAGERRAVPDKQVAYLFLNQGLRMLKPHGRLCLMQPSGFLYNLQSHGFRSDIAKSGRIRAILDFTSVYGLYERANKQTIAILAGDQASSEILHLTFRRTYRTAQRIGFELDHYDRQRLSIDDMIADPRAARANLLGGGRLVTISARLREIRTLLQFVVELKQREWVMGEGFIGGNKAHPADHLAGQSFMPTEALSDDGIDITMLTTVSDTMFERPRNPHLFEPPLVLIRANESLPMAYWNKGTLTFRDKIVGIHAPMADKSQHKRLYDRLDANRDYYRFVVMLRGSQVLVGKATALPKSDIESLPYPEDDSDLSLTFWEQALADDTLEYFAAYVRQGQRSELLTRKADIKVLGDYSSLFCRMLSSLYDNLRASTPIFLNGLICQPFFFGDEPTIDWLGPNCEPQLAELVFSQTLPSLRTGARRSFLSRKRDLRH